MGRTRSCFGRTRRGQRTAAAGGRQRDESSAAFIVGPTGIKVFHRRAADAILLRLVVHPGSGARVATTSSMPERNVRLDAFGFQCFEDFGGTIAAIGGRFLDRTVAAILNASQLFKIRLVVVSPARSDFSIEN